MSNLSDFLGGSGGGGDPQATFQASANVTNGDLVVLNDNGTVEPVFSTAVAADYTKSDNGTKIHAGGTPTYGMTSYSANYNETHDKYVFFLRYDNGNLYGDLRSGTYSSSTETYNTNFRGQFSCYANWMSQKRSPNEGYLLGYRAQNGYIYVRGIRWNGSDYTLTGEGTANTASTSSTDCYCEASGDGSSSFAVAAMSGNGCPGVVHGTWDGTSTGPVHSGTIQGQLSDNINTSYGTNWGNNSLCGAHVKDDVHVFGGNKGGNGHIFACRVESGGTTYGDPHNTGYAQNGYTSRIIYDSETGVGVYQLYSGTGGAGPKYITFSVDTDSLAITQHGIITLPDGFTGYASGLGWNPTAKSWVAVDHMGGEIFTFKLDSTGNITKSYTGQFAPNAPTPSSVRLQFQMLFPVHGSGAMGILFNGDAVISGGGAGSYMDTSNHLYVSQFDIPYVSTNIDSHFGEAKEAITSGNAGPVAILNRTKDIPDSTFQKGQKLFANPSGSALATSGTYRVGYATDADTILVTGDPS
jgi:hypothetical protein